MWEQKTIDSKEKEEYKEKKILLKHTRRLKFEKVNDKESLRVSNS